jgi:anti-sigma factor RsiW
VAAVAQTTAATLTGQLFANLATGFFASRLSHRLEALTFARTHAFTRVVFGFAVVLAFAAIHAITVNVGVGSHRVGGNTGKQGSGGQSESGTSSSGLDSHFSYPR